jgi:hypothetical protein
MVLLSGGYGEDDMSITTRKQEVLIAALLAAVITGVVAIVAVAGAKTAGAFIAGAAMVVIFVALSNRKLQREKRK